MWRSKKLISNDSEKDKDHAYKALAREISLSDHKLLTRLYSVSKPDKPTEDLIYSYITNSLCHPHISVNIAMIMQVSSIGEEHFPKDSPSLTKPYRMLLWHGTTLSGIQGILKNGFALPNLPSNNLMYGSGIYFADRFSKSAQYCDENKKCRPARGTRGYMLLCDVSLGKRYKAYKSKNGVKSAPPGFDSYKGQGRNRPDWKDNRIYEGSVMPIGETVPDDQFEDYNLEYNEYIVFDPKRIHIKFVVIVDFCDDQGECTPT